jgi:Lon protease-like protein
MPILPMFPLGSVLLPSAFLPLHVFEARYRQLVSDCLDGDREFGVVLIERGSEVGGGDQRASIGTVARILEAVSFDDGRWALGTVGTRRIRVTDWLDDDPYPRAEVEDWDDPGAENVATEARAGLTAALRKVLAYTAELGESSAPATLDLSDDAVLASYQAISFSPFGPADRQRLLAVPGTAERIRRLTHLLDEEAGYLARRLELGGEAGADDDDDDDAGLD